MHIIAYAIRFYHRYHTALRDVSEELHILGIKVSYDSIPHWIPKYADKFVYYIRRALPQPTDKWHLDEMYTKINGQRYVLWRAVDSNGFALDILTQITKSKKAAIKFFKRLLSMYDGTVCYDKNGWHTLFKFFNSFQQFSIGPEGNKRDPKEF